MRTKFVLYFVVLMLAATATSSDYSNREDVDEFIGELVTKHQFNETLVRQALEQAIYKQKIIDAITRPAEKMTWDAYRKILVTSLRVENGIAFAHENVAVLKQAEIDFGVPVEIIVAIIGIETNYGRTMGSYRVLDALATLGFDYPPRAEFFRGQLGEFFVLACEERVKPFDGDEACVREQAGNTLGSSFEIGDLVGSYAGAMGYGQFIPSSYRNFAIDYDGDGARDIWHNITDAIGSVAAYFADHGWEAGEPTIVEVDASQASEDIRALANQSLTPTKSVAEWRMAGVPTDANVDDEMAALFMFETDGQTRFYLGFNNFYVITRYNISRLYAKAIVEVSEGVAAGL